MHARAMKVLTCGKYNLDIQCPLGTKRTGKLERNGRVSTIEASKREPERDFQLVFIIIKCLHLVTVE